jgi:hypothetical protein
MKGLIALAAAAAIGLAAPLSFAQGPYPSKPIKLIVPVTTGGPSDLVARILGDKLSSAFGKPVIIELAGHRRPSAPPRSPSPIRTARCRRPPTWRSTRS